jgi:D-galactarolactone cycloisomerase
MVITEIRTRVVEFPLERPFVPAWARGRNQPSLLMVLVEVQTDAGLVGISAAHGGMEAAIAIDRFVAPFYLGANPGSVEQLAAVHRDAEILGPPVYCMEIALWDLVGQACDMPVYRLWGGARSRVLAYCATAEVRDPEIRVADVEQLSSQGYRAVKLRFHKPDPREDLRVVEAIRTRLGDRIDVIVDANQAGVEPGLDGHRVWGRRTAAQIARGLERLDVLWLEEPLPRHDLAGLRHLREGLQTLRLAGGEDNHGLHEFRQLVEQGCYDILQPDALLSEGVFQMRKIAAVAEAAQLDVVPHTWGNGIGLLANLHLCAAVPNCPMIEFPHEPNSGFTLAARDQMLSSPLQIDGDGHVPVPELPGFGFQLDHERIDRYTAQTFTTSLSNTKPRRAPAGLPG